MGAGSTALDDPCEPLVIIPLDLRNTGTSPGSASGLPFLSNPELGFGNAQEMEPIIL